jgi:thymidylate synthase (FAD)
MLKKTSKPGSAEYHQRVVSQGHGSVAEHVTMVFALENVSRVLTHELVRHRVGVGYSQESLRYVRLTDLGVWLPEWLTENDEAFKIVSEMIQHCEYAQLNLARIFDIKNQPFAQKKKLTSCFRRLAPIGLATGIVFSANVRSLRLIIEKRTDPAAEEEIRLVFGKVFEIARLRCPAWFSDFEKIDTGDGLYQCKPKHSKV